MNARKLFFASIVYLPILMGFMVADRNVDQIDFWVNETRTNFVEDTSLPFANHTMNETIGYMK